MDKSKPKTMLGRQPVRLEGSLILILSQFNKAKRLTRRGIELVLKIGYLWFHIFGQRALGIWSLGKSFLDAVFIKIFRQFANWLRCRRDKKFTCKECYVIQKAYIFQGVRKGGGGEVVSLLFHLLPEELQIDDKSWCFLAYLSKFTSTEKAGIGRPESQRKRKGKDNKGQTVIDGSVETGYLLGTYRRLAQKLKNAGREHSKETSGFLSFFSFSFRDS